MQFMDLGAYSLVERSSEATETGPRTNNPMGVWVEYSPLARDLDLVVTQRCVISVVT